MSLFVVLLMVGAGSYVLRVVPLLVLQRSELPPAADAMIRRAGLAAMSALISTSTHAAAQGTTAAPALLAVLVGGVLAARKATMVQILVVGGALFACATAVIERM
jgi:branched-subunit amino acid transport protein